MLPSLGPSQRREGPLQTLTCPQAQSRGVESGSLLRPLRLPAPTARLRLAWHGGGGRSVRPTS